MDTIVGVIRKLIYENSDNDFKIFDITRKDRSITRVQGDFSNIVRGAKIELHGSYKQHPKYGISFKADAHSYGYNEDVQSICLYIQSIAKWIGPERAYKIADHFGSDIQNIIESNPERLLEIEGIGEKVAESLSEAWLLNSNLKNIRIFLHGLGLGVGKIKKIITMFGTDTDSILRENPWILCRNGFGFSTCDSIAYKLGLDMNCRFRYEYFILNGLDKNTSSGHLYLHPEQLVDLFNNYSKKSEYCFKDNIVIKDIAPHIRNLIKEGYVINENNRIYDISNFFYENECARLLSKVYGKNDTCKLDDFNVGKFISRYEAQNKISLSDAQKDVLRSFVKEKVMVITGSPGTGKTTVSRALVQIMKENSISFELLTPTGIAAKKLGNTCGCEAYTIHRRLGYKGTKWDYNINNKYTTQVVIVDESSMVDQELLYRLLSAVHYSTKIVFVGDNDQLPSVGPGNVLKELIDSKVFKTVFLDIIFRQEECSDIIKGAKKIRDGDIDLSLFKGSKDADIWHIKEKNVGKIEQVILDFSKQLKEKVKDKGNLNFQIITPRNQGPLSVETLNNLLQSVLNPPDSGKKELKVGAYKIRKGDRVIICKNNYELGVFNGDIGKVAFITIDKVTVDIENFSSSSNRVEIPMSKADEILKLAYAITVHKCIQRGTLIQTDRGLLPIEEIVIGDSVLTHKGRYKRVTWAGFVGNKAGRCIRTYNNEMILSSDEHKWLIMRDSEHLFIEAMYVKSGDYLCRPDYNLVDNKIILNMDNNEDRCRYIYQEVKDNVVYDEVEPMYDLTIEDDESYLASDYFCHNSQGMEYSMVILPFIKEHGRLLLQRNLLYTAITRAKKKVIVLGHTSAIENAILNDKIQRRNTKFSKRINSWIGGKGISLKDIFSKSNSYQNSKVLNQLLSLEEL